MIDGVLLKALTTHSDDRGFFREVIRVSDPFFPEGFGQLSHSLVYPGVVKAWHSHKVQVQWTYVVCGVLNVVLYDGRSASATHGTTMEFLAGDGQQACVYRLPAGVLHGYRCISGPSHVIYVTSGVYDTQD